MNVEIVLAFVRIILLIGVITMIVLITTQIPKKNQKSYLKTLKSNDSILDLEPFFNSTTSTANPQFKTVTYEIGPTSIGRLQN